jgi:hypothetical protein
MNAAKVNANAERFRAIMRAYGLTREQASVLARVSKKTVDSWLAPVGSASHRSMPDNVIELVELKVTASMLGKRE